MNDTQLPDEQSCPYLVFTGDTFYAEAGWQGFRGRHATLEEALDCAQGSIEQPLSVSWWQVVDIRESRIVAEAGQTYH